MSAEKQLVRTNFSKKELSDAGMAAVLLCLIAGFLWDNLLFFKIAVPVVVLTMILPVTLYPFAVIWYNLANILSQIASRILLSIVYFGLVFPVGLIRRMAGKDSLKLKLFKKDTTSVMVNIDKVYTKEDLKKPF
jgi:hypothetical protein